MVKFKTLTYKNFESVGNHPITIQLDRHQTTLLSGMNGSGKCVDKRTEIGIMIEDKEVLKAFKRMFSK